MKESPELAMRYLDALADDEKTAPGNSRARRLAYVQEAPKMLEFLLQQMTRLEEQSRIRERNAAYLTKQLEQIPGIIPARTY